MDEDGAEQFEETIKGDITVGYFTKLFQTTNPSDPTELLEGFEAKVTPAMNRELLKPIMEGEIPKAVKIIKSDSAPGVDGFSGKIFQSFWLITRPQIMKEVQQFFEGGLLP